MGRSALYPGLQCTASGVSVHCVRTCSALRPKRENGHGNLSADAGHVDIPWGIIELVLWRTALQADTYVFGFIRAHLHFVPMYTGYSW